jgi:hypothetical protein
MKQILLLCSILLLSISLAAQDSRAASNTAPLPESPSASRIFAESDVSTSGTPFTVQPVRPTPQSLVILAAPPREKRVVIRSFILASLFHVGATIGDIETTQYGLSHGHKEGNPLVGSAPSRKLQYAVAVPVAGVVVGWSYRAQEECSTFDILAHSAARYRHDPHCSAFSQFGGRAVVMEKNTKMLRCLSVMAAVLLISYLHAEEVPQRSLDRVDNKSLAQKIFDAEQSSIASFAKSQPIVESYIQSLDHERSCRTDNRRCVFPGTGFPGC